MVKLSGLRIRRLEVADAALFRDIRLEALQKNPEAFGGTFEHESAQPLAWFAQGLEAVGEEPLQSVDPGGAIARAIPLRHVIGCVVHLSAATAEPGLVVQGGDPESKNVAPEEFKAQMIGTHGSGTMVPLEATLPHVPNSVGRSRSGAWARQSTNVSPSSL